MFAFTAELSSFSGLASTEAVAVVQHLVDALVRTNVGYLRTHPATPYLYQSGVYYCRDDRGRERQWWDVPAVLKNRCADCKALAAWRAAELVVRGVPAEAIVQTSDGVLFHVVVRVRNQIEDPSAILGMHGVV